MQLGIIVKSKATPHSFIFFYSYQTVPRPLLAVSYLSVRLKIVVKMCDLGGNTSKTVPECLGGDYSMLYVVVPISNGKPVHRGGWTGHLFPGFSGHAGLFLQSSSFAHS